MRKLLSAVLLLLASACALGQGATVLFPPAVTQQGTFLPFAKITFCTTPATLDTLGNCTNTISVFKDQALTQPYTSAIQTDGIGYFPPNANTATSLWFASAANLCFTLTTSNMSSPSTNPCTPFSVGASPGTSPSFVIVNATTGYQINGAALAGRYLKGNGTNFVQSAGSASGTGACGANQYVNTLNSDAAPTCSQVAYAQISGTPAIPSIPTGTGFFHVTAGAGDAASKLVNLTASTDVAANQGTTTTVLHGNGAGQAAFGSVVQADVSNGYVDLSSTQTAAGAKDFSGAVRTQTLNNSLVVGSGAGQFSSMASCYTSASAGQTCLVSPNWSETFGSQLVMSKNDVGFYFMGAATINMSTFGILVSDGVIGAFLNSPLAFGGCPTDTGSGTPVKFTYTGSGDAIATGTVGGATGTLGLGLQNICVDISGATAAVGIHNFCANHAYLSGVAIIGFNGANTQKGIVWDDCATNNGGANTVSGIEIIRPKIAWQMSGNERENDFAGLRLAGLTSPIAGSIGIDLQANVKNNFFHGGFISGYITGINFGGTSNFNDFHIEVDLDSGGGGAQDVVFGAGTFNNEVVRTSDVGAYVFTDSGNGNCLRNTASTCVVKRIDLVAQNNNIGATLLFAVPANTTIINQSGMYRVSCYAVVTTAAGTSSTLPNVQIIWTDNDTNVASTAINCTPSNPNNTVGSNSFTGAGAGAGIGDNPTINVRAGTNINYQTVSYASNPANAMQYALHLKVEYLGQ